MQNLIILMTIVLASILTMLNGQSKYEIEMQKAMTEFGAAESSDDLEKVAQHFDRIAKVESRNWLPLYYAMFIRTLNAFSQNKAQAIKTVDEIDAKYVELDAISPENSEILTLRGLYRTVKVAKDPGTYAMSLSGAIIKDYDDALNLNPKNARALYLLAQYNMGAAEFWGTDPKEHCPQIEQAKALLVAESDETFEPHWGEKQVDEILNTTCKK